MFASEQTTPSTSTSTGTQRSPLCRHFDFLEIRSITRNFDESLVVGSGGFGKVYKANIYNGSTLVTAAIKRLDAMSSQGASEFWAEVEMLSKLRHCHLVPLVGYCSYEREMILVYEFMPNGTLEEHLHKLGSPLSWCQRVKTCIGAARGLDYLHSGTGIEFGIIHRDVKSSNILLDESWAAKVSDFGLSKLSPKNQASTHVSTLVKGTFGYFDPYYFNTGQLTRKSDVYAFGVILFEVLCRKRAVDRSLDSGLAIWAQDSIKEGRLKEIVDVSIRGEISTKCLKGFAKIAERCLDNHPKNRPTMTEVVQNLEHVLVLQEKANNLLQTGGKTILGRMVDRFSFTDDGQNSGTQSGSLMPRKSRMDIGSLMPKKRNAHVQEGVQLLKDKLESGVSSTKVFRAEELKKATMNFAKSMIIGRDSFGTMYKGILPDSRVLAIKRFEKSMHEEFMNEVEILGQISHKNVVRLLGCCFDGEILMLVFEFSSNGTLKEHIHDNTSRRGSLSWDSRLRIAHESAGALAYLHSDAMTTIIHRAVKSANILLDENCTVKVAHFGSSKTISLNDDHVTTKLCGTFGYLDPEYMHTGKLTDKCDVYSFGVVLAELLTGLEPINHERDDEDAALSNYFVKATKESRLNQIIEGQVLEEASDEQLEALCSLVCRCLEKEGQHRPSMKEVSMELERLRKRTVHPWVRHDENNQTSSLAIEKGQHRPSMKEVSMELERLRKRTLHPWVRHDENNQTSSLTIESEQSDLYGYPIETDQMSSRTINSEHSDLLGYLSDASGESEYLNSGR